ncbi:Hypothetical predicted protein [Cloeon dipterum]|uniref:TBC1 domain family member 7 n=1 Tax=Cloeon dipterum TaxID=197152 RepID=A0A8S1E2H1_9INSE|nr:Hypothetical predicted protein [Cloeon dipterum]
MATADERNFRSSYYEKVGFRNVEEKKSLEILLKEKSLDKIKLNHFCLRFPVPGIHRSYLWKLLLGVLPMQVACHDYVWSCREQSFNDLDRQMKVLKLEYPSAPHNLVIMWLLETNGVPTGCTNPLQLNPINENFAKLAAMMMEFFDNDVEVYWVSKGFFNFLSRLAIEMPKLSECTLTLLEKEDCELNTYMQERELLANLPLFDWYTSMFAVVLSESSLCKIWDKMVGGSYKILIFVAVALCVNLKKQIMSCETLDHLLILFENVSEDMSEVVVNKALDLWQQHGNLINIGLEFSIKHNPTALWAAQQTSSMPNLSSVSGQSTTGFLERQVTVPDVHLMKDLYLWDYQEPEKCMQEKSDDVTDSDKFSDPLPPKPRLTFAEACDPQPQTLVEDLAKDCNPQTQTRRKNLADSKLAAKRLACGPSSAVIEQHMKKITYELSKLKLEPSPEREKGDSDEPWMMCSRANQQYGKVHFEPEISSESCVIDIVDSGDDEAHYYLLCREILPKFWVFVGVNVAIVALLILVWKMYFLIF